MAHGGGRKGGSGSGSVDPGVAVEIEVRANVLAQRVGVGTVADLNLPQDFLIRVADRAIRGSFYERHRAVVGVPSGTPSADGTPDREVSDAALRGGPRSDGAQAGSSDRVPALASFRSPETDSLRTRDLLVDVLPDHPDHHREREPRRIVRARLAREGLLPTLARVILHLGSSSFLEASEAHTNRLVRFGLPLDLLRWFEVEGVPAAKNPEDHARAVVGHIAALISRGERIEKVERALRRAKFVPRQSLPGFRPTSESGGDEANLLRVQFTRSTHFSGAGDGGCLDLVQSVAAALACNLVAAAPADAASDVAALLAQASRSEPARRVWVTPLPARPSQWAGDNGKGGSVNSAPAVLLPRFAGRREDATLFVEADDLAVSRLNAPEPHGPGITTARSPLLFEGGNLLVCDDRRRGDRVLLIGEAEVWRNQALGLSREQAIEALRVELACERAIVLPASSYHIDQEVLVRTGEGGRPVAFLPDVVAGTRLVLRAGLERLSQRWGVRAQEALGHLESRRDRECLTLLWSGLHAERLPEGTWPLAFAEVLSTSPVDSGIGNLHRLLLAADHLAAEVADPAEFAEGHYRAVIRSYVRREQDRRSLRSKLEGLGWKVVLVPALPEDSRGVNALNAVQLRNLCLVPAYGGLFASLDEAAFAALSEAMGSEVRVVGVPSAESQRREGAVHCSVSVCGW